MLDFLAFAQANAILAGIFITLVLLTLGFEIQKLTKPYGDVGPDETVRLINRENAAILDLREAHELGNGTIQSAKHLPVSVLRQRLGDIDSLKNTPLIAFCANGIRAPAACRVLKKNGFSKVYHLKGGIAAWQQANMPLVKKQ